jgi:hypothetical protein
LYCNVLVTWPKDAPFVKWLFTTVTTSLRKYKLDTEIEERLITQLRPLELLDIRKRTRSSHLHGAQPAPNINSNAGKRAKRRLTNWRFREGSPGDTHLIDIEVGGGLYWVTEEDAHRKFKHRLLEFWNRRGGREKAIREAGRNITNNTNFLIHEILDERPEGSEYYVEWVGYGNESRSWEPKSGIPAKLIHAFKQGRLRQRLGVA